MKVAIAGAGNVGQFLANDLVAAGHAVLLLEQNREVVNRASKTPGIEWRVVDACEVTSLREAELDTVDVVVAATGDDEDNLVISLLAKQEFAVPRVIARVNHPANQWMFNETWGVDVAVSTPHLILGLVEEAVTVGQLVRLFQLEGGQAQLVEVTLTDQAPINGKRISEIEIPRNANFVAIVRQQNVIVPRGDTLFETGDEVLVLVRPDAEDEVRRLLTGS